MRIKDICNIETLILVRLKMSIEVKKQERLKAGRQCVKNNVNMNNLSCNEHRFQKRHLRREKGPKTNCTLKMERQENSM